LAIVVVVEFLLLIRGRLVLVEIVVAVFRISGPCGATLL
jgi:hypothetical protein